MVIRLAQWKMIPKFGRLAIGLFKFNFMNFIHSSPSLSWSMIKLTSIFYHFFWLKDFWGQL